MLIFIFGFLENNSGKTTVARALISCLKVRGFKVSGFKPLSGHSFWWQYNSYLKCVEKGSLFSEDAYILWKTMNEKIPVEVLNPADVLLSVPNLEKLYRFKNFSLLYNSSTMNWFVAGRFTFLDGKKKKDLIYYNKRENLLIKPEKLIASLKKRNTLLPVSNPKEFLDLHRKYYRKSVETCFQEISKKFSLIVAEGFNDAVYPWKGVEKAGLVLGVSPGFVSIFGNKEFTEAIHARGKWELTTSADIINLMKPLKTVKFPHLTSKEVESDEAILKKAEKSLEEILSHFLQMEDRAQEQF